MLPLPPYSSPSTLLPTYTMVKLSSQSLLLSILLQSNWVDSFAVASIERHRRDQRSSSLVLFAAESNADDRLNDDQKDKEASFQELNNRVQKLQVEHTREQLEQAHTQSFLKRRPVKLPYNEARRWVQVGVTNVPTAGCGSLMEVTHSLCFLVNLPQTG